MANNHGGSGSKFVPVNLNKLYGQPSHNNYPPHSGTYGPGVGTNRARLGGHASGGGGMVVLSRNRPLQKAMPKLSVPPPLNLPSLRKEYEKIDSSGAGGGVAGGAGLGSGSRPSSSGMGWTKPANVTLQEKEVSSDTLVSESLNYNEGASTKGSGTYMPPSARFGAGLGHGDMMSSHRSNASSLERATVLRGEDFPSLRAALPVSTGPAQKQKEESFQKLKQLVSEESSNDLRSNTHISSSVHVQSSFRVADGVNENGGHVPRSSSERVDHTKKQEDFLPLVWLNPRSDWADDERDTSHGFVGRSGRDHELPKSETYWDRDIDVPRSSILPHKPLNTLSESSQHIGSVVKGSTFESLKTDPFRKERNFHSREDRDNNSWRNYSIHKDRSTAPQVTSGQHVTMRDNHSYHYGTMTGNRDVEYGRRDTVQGRQGGQKQWNHSVESPRYRREGYQNSTGSKSFFSSFAKNEPTNLDDHYQKDLSSSVYDEKDPFTGNLVGVVKRKKEVTKLTDFHDPVRESFEAELERVQKMQEMERQRIVEEQKRALEQTRREDEERWRVVIEEEERQRKMEEEAREAAWRAEQEQMEAIHKAEELKMDREEEKRRMLLEEERRKQAAKQKLLELEAKIAKRQAEVEKTGNSVVHSGAENGVPIGVKDNNDAFIDSDLDNWEISQRMVDRITTSANSDSSAIDKPFDWPPFSREASSSFVDRKNSSVNPWKRDAFEVGSNSSFLLNDQENGHNHSTMREASSTDERSFPRKDIHGGEYTSSRSPFRRAIQDSDIDGLSHLGDRDQRWNSFESEFYEDNTSSSFSGKLYMNSYGRSRYSTRQPRVLPPPSLTSAPKFVRGDNELTDPSSSVELTARTANLGGPQDKNEMLRCDSQSSLSVSSPPSSPTHLSNDELDGSAGCSVITTAAEGKDDLVDDETTMVASKYVSADEDEEWSVGNHNEMQEQEEYDEDDGYGVEDEVHEGHDDNINSTLEFEHMNHEEKNSSNGIENVVLGFNEGVEVNIPADEFERDSKTEISVVDVEKQAEVDAVNREQPQNGHVSGSFSLLGVPSAQKMVSSTADMSSSSSVGQSPTHVLSSFSNQTDVPVKLQFGLFSGLSLIPSPVPSIQIGSIQMPLHLHSSVASPMAHIHPSQPPPPLFQFGQLRYTSQPMSLVQPNTQYPHFGLHQNSASSLPNQFVQENPVINSKDIGSPILLNNQSGNVSNPPNENWSGIGVGNSQSNMPNATDNRIASTQAAQTDEKRHATASSRDGKNVLMSKAPGPLSANRVRTNAYPPRKSGTRTFQSYDPSNSNEIQRKHRRPIQRTEFRVREIGDGRPHLGTGSFYNSGLDDNKGMGSYTRSGYRRHTGFNTSLKRVVPETSGSQEVVRPVTVKTPATSSSCVEVNLKRNIPEEDVDAPLQTGVVRVFKQPGIECPSDEDDFIEVRSKRQMLNDRREQREKEIKAKSRVTKQPRKARSSFQGNASSTGRNKITATLVGEASSSIRSDGRGLVNKEPLAPIGTPTVDIHVQTGIKSHTNKTLQKGSAPATSGPTEDDVSNLSFETESKAVDNVQTSLGDWGNERIDQQVIPLTQTQLDDAMKPARFNTTHVTSIGDHTTLVSDTILSSSSILTKGISIASSSSPVNSLLAGEKIQFGAVTSPTVLPSSNRVVSHAIGSPGSFRPDITQNPKIESECNIFFKKDEHSTEDREAEVEAAASAVVVAAIDTDEIVGNGMGPISCSETKKVGGAVEGIQGGLAVDQQSGSQSKPDESLSVSLPADLSVETLPISLWPPLPSPQGSSTQMLSHFHGAHPSQFPFYEMNHPMMGGPVFALGSHDESSRGTQSQPQKTAGPGSRHIGPWQNHSGMDSFYGPPTPYTGPFIGSPGGIPGVQPPPPHMVVYNHYAPVGQFGQVGLSFMGTTYIPSGKQPDWKHDPTSSSRGEEDIKSLNIGSGPRNPPNMQPPIQHLAPGSPLLPVGPMLTMFDVPPFQTAPEMSAQARWSHMPASPLHVVPMSLPLQQQTEEMTGPSQFDQSTYPSNRFSEPQSSTPSNVNGLVFPVVRDSTITHFPDELAGPSISTSSGPVAISHISSGTTQTGDAAQLSVGGDNVKFKNQHHRHGKNLSSQQYSNHPGGYGYNHNHNHNQRGGGVSPKNKSTGQWSQRRTGLHGRYQPTGAADKSFPPSTKVKQIYVAKQPASGSSTQST